MNDAIECEQEEDGRWLAEVMELSGVMAYGATMDEAVARVEALALRVLAEQLENGETPVEARAGRIRVGSDRERCPQ
ncbi:MAG: type II toxin-antitoxin system HicB family antitoxin [Magnetococcales bacterium]|nr:type II toxin-antitoxin system HicB family antitoxin [Magnetococcales bacterium]